MIKILSSNTCTKCAMAKKVMESNKINFEVVNTDSEEGKEIIEKYEVMSLPFFYNGDYHTYDFNQVLSMGNSF